MNEDEGASMTPLQAVHCCHEVRHILRCIFIARAKVTRQRVDDDEGGGPLGQNDLVNSIRNSLSRYCVQKLGSHLRKEEWRMVQGDVIELFPSRKTTFQAVVSFTGDVNDSTLFYRMFMKWRPRSYTCGYVEGKKRLATARLAKDLRQ